MVDWEVMGLLHSRFKTFIELNDVAIILRLFEKENGKIKPPPPFLFLFKKQKVEIIEDFHYLNIAFEFETGMLPI